MASRKIRHRKQKSIRRTRPPGRFNLFVLLGVLVAVNLYVFLLRDQTSVPAVMKAAALAEPRPSAFPHAAVASRASVVTALGKNTAGWKEGQVLSGDSLGKILSRERIGTEQADRILRSLEPHLDFRSIRQGQRYRLQLRGDGLVNIFEFHVSRLRTVRATRLPSGKFRGSKVEAKTSLRVLEVAGTVDVSLYNSIRDLGENAGLVAMLVDVFAYDLNFYVDAQKGDSFRMIVEKEYLGDEFIRYRRVVAAEYRTRSATHRAFHWKIPSAEKAGYFDADGSSLERTFLKTPLKYGRVSSKFSKSRMHPVLHKRRAHLGVDYAAPTGTPVSAAADGTIIYRGRRGGGGNVVMIRHGNGLVTEYLHLSRFRRGQRVGTVVRQKNVIGYVGSTGLSTGPHLHFGVKKNGRYVDPLRFRTDQQSGVPRRFRGEFRRHRKKLMTKLNAIPNGNSGVAIAVEKNP